MEQTLNSLNPQSLGHSCEGESSHTSATFIINGMNCNHCRTSAEKAILSVEGVTSASVDLTTKIAVVEGTATAEAICKAVEEVCFTCTKA